METPRSQLATLGGGEERRGVVEDLDDLDAVPRGFHVRREP